MELSDVTALSLISEYQHIGVSILLFPMNDNLVLNTLGVYSIMCECGEVYTGRMVHYIKTGILNT
jgi:hypothetical protein